MPRPKAGFDQWMKQVKKFIDATWYGAVELEEAPYQEYFDRGLSPRRAAAEAMDFAYRATHPPGIHDW